MLSVCLSRAGEMGEDNNGRRLKKSAESRSCASAGAENFFFFFHRPQKDFKIPDAFCCCAEAQFI